MGGMGVTRGIRGFRCWWKGGDEVRVEALGSSSFCGAGAAVRARARAGAGALELARARARVGAGAAGWELVWIWCWPRSAACVRVRAGAVFFLSGSGRLGRGRRVEKLRGSAFFS